MKHALIVVVLGILSVSLLPAQTSQAVPEKATLATRTAGLQKHDGFFPYYWDEKKGTLLFELSPSAMDRGFLYFTGLGSGVGSTEAFADRSSCRGRSLVPAAARRRPCAGDRAEHRVPRPQRQPRPAAVRDRKLSNIGAGIASHRGRAGRSFAGQRHRVSGSRLFRFDLAVKAAQSCGLVAE